MSPRRFALPTCLLLVMLTVQVLAPTAGSAASGTLSVSPKVFVGGQLLTFEGYLGPANQRIRLQSRAVNRSGAKWVDVDGSWSSTDGSGRFSFQHPAPSMFNKSYRVVGGGSATDGVVLNARSQDLVLTPVDPPVAGRAFDILVDTVPGPHRAKDSAFFLSHRPDLPPPVFPGRDLTLQQRDGKGWRTVGSTTTDSRGQGTFTVTVDDPGAVVYRVREEDYPQAGGPPIGWFPSFPTRVTVASRQAAARGTAASRTAPTPLGGATGGGATRTAVARSGGAANTTAAQKYGWRPSQWDFAWEAGESLTSPPHRGKDPQGWWLDTSTGSGRAAKHNGGLNLESSRHFDGPGDVGTTAVTMQGNPMTFGRWEVRIRAKAVESNARDFRQRVELVPSRAADYCRGKRNITVAQFAAHGRKMQFGVKSVRRHRRWNGGHRLVRSGNVNNRPLAFAVEVTRKHVSFFYDGKVVGTAPRAAVPRVPLTLRLSQVGRGQHEMNSTEGKYDWMRGFSLKRGKKVTGHKLRSRRLRGHC